MGNGQDISSSRNTTKILMKIHAKKTTSNARLISTFETKTRSFFFQSGVRDKNENFFCSISGYEMKTRIKIERILKRISKTVFFARLQTDIFRKRLFIFQCFLKQYVFFSEEVWIKIYILETRTRTSFILCFEMKMRMSFFNLVLSKSFLVIEWEKIS